MALGSSAMSMEAHVFFRGKLPTKAALSRAMKELGFPFSITPSTGSLEHQSGFMPMKRRGEETGVEFDVYSDHAAVEEFADVGVDAGFERRASLGWGGDFQEAVAGMSAAAAPAKLMNGVVFDEARISLRRSSIQGEPGCGSPSTRRRLGARAVCRRSAWNRTSVDVRRTAVFDRALDPAPARAGSGAAGAAGRGALRPGYIAAQGRRDPVRTFDE